MNEQRHSARMMPHPIRRRTVKLIGAQHQREPGGTWQVLHEITAERGITTPFGGETIR